MRSMSTSMRGVGRGDRRPSTVAFDHFRKDLQPSARCEFLLRKSFTLTTSISQDSDGSQYLRMYVCMRVAIV